jgi:hypothetical protein
VSVLPLEFTDIDAEETNHDNNQAEAIEAILEYQSSEEEELVFKK